jgi:hypothetical protein
MRRPTRYAIPKFYYLLTPAFMLLDYAGGVNVRAAVLDTWPVYKNLYYGFCILCGILVFVVPRASGVVAISESLIIIVVTMVGLFLPVLEAIEHVATLEGDWGAAESFGFEHATNLGMAFTIAIVAFRLNLGAIAASSERAAQQAGSM